MEGEWDRAVGKIEGKRTRECYRDDCTVDIYEEMDNLASVLLLILKKIGCSNKNERIAQTDR